MILIGMGIIALFQIAFFLSEYFYERQIKTLKKEILNLEENKIETQNETQQTQEEITKIEVSIDPKMQPSTMDLMKVTKYVLIKLTLKTYRNEECAENVVNVMFDYSLN